VKSETANVKSDSNVIRLTMVFDTMVNIHSYW